MFLKTIKEYFVQRPGLGPYMSVKRVNGKLHLYLANPKCNVTVDERVLPQLTEAINNIYNEYKIETQETLT